MDRSPRNVFISYRREDSAPYAGRIADSLESSLGEGAVFMDVESIGAGTDFMAEVSNALDVADAVLVVIGPSWIGARGPGSRRIDDEGDFVRIEVEAALASSVRLIPVLVAGAAMPAETELPAALATLSRVNAVELRDRGWREDVRSLLDLLRERAVRCPECGKDNLRDASSCIRCRAAFASPEAHEARKTITVLACSVSVSSDSGREVDPETYRQLLERVSDRVKIVIETDGGFVDNAVRGLTLAVFGVPSVREDDAFRAVKAAIQIRQDIAALAERASDVAVASRVAVGTGEAVVVAGVGIGTPETSGEVLDSTSTLAYAAAPGEILLDPTTCQLVRDAALVEPLDGPHAFRLIELDPDAESGVARRSTPVFVGRSRETLLLDTALERTRSERTCQLFTLVGSPGVGKSRLVAEVVSSVTSRILTGRCLPYGEGITFWPLLQILKQAVDIEDADSPEEVRAKVRSLAAPLPQAEPLAATLLSLVGLEEAAGSIEQTFWAVRKLLEILARDDALVVVIDDIQWAEPTLLELIEHVLERSASSPILLLCLARPELLETRPDWGTGIVNASIMRLEPLSEAESGELAEGLLEGAPLEATVATKVAAAAGGNPLFVEEFLAMLLEDKLLQRQGDRWVAAVELHDIEVPPTISALLAARLDRLSAEEATLVQDASVVGEAFRRSALEALAPESLAPDVASYLRVFVRKDLIRPDGDDLGGEDEYRFRHLLIHDAAYRTVPKAMRAELHERLADWLEQSAGERLAEVEEIVGYHLEQAWRYGKEIERDRAVLRELGQRAASHLIAAATRASDRGDARAEADLLRRARDVATIEGVYGFDLLMRLSSALIRAGRFDEAPAVTKEMSHLVTRSGDEVLQARSEILALDMRISAGELEKEIFEAALARAADLLAILERAGSDEGLLEYWSLLSTLEYGIGHNVASDVARVHAIEHARRLGNARAERARRAEGSVTALFGPTPVPEALDTCRELLEAVGTHRIARAFVLSCMSGLMAMAGDIDDARLMSEEARDMLVEVGALQLELGLSLVRGAIIEVLAEDWTRAERELRRDFERQTEVGERWNLPTTAAMLGRVVAKQERYAEALALTDVAEQTSPDGDIVSQVAYRQVRGVALAGLGDAEAGERLALDACVLADETDYLSYRADAWADLGSLRRIKGDLEGAAGAEESALALYQQKGNLAAERASRARLQKDRGRA